MTATAHTGVDTADFYAYEQLLTEDERATLHRVRDFMTAEVQPVLLEHWSKATFPFEILPGLRALGIGGLPYRGYGCPGQSFLLDGMIAMELARTDCSIATFNGVHSGLAMGSIQLCGSDEQRERYLPAMARFEKIGSFGLTEPEDGSGASRGLQTTAERVGDEWILYVPPELGYGEQGNPKIPANSVLVFDLELLAIKDPAKAEAADAPAAPAAKK